MNNQIKINRLLITAVIMLIMLIPHVVTARPNRGALGSCKVSPLIDYIQPATDYSKDETINIATEYAESDELTAALRGNVVVLQGDEKVSANALDLDRTNNILSGKDQLIRYATPTSVVEGQSILSYLNDKKSETTDAIYYFRDMDAQGKAKKINSDQIKKQALLEESTYSTCPPTQEAWSIRAKKLHLDQVLGRGVARNATFSMFGTPLLYTPYISFPLDDRRQSGFLFPIISMDTDGGFSLRTPYYLNIAPNFDMTLTPGFYTKRGLILGAEARYLSSWQSAILSFEFLPSDRAFSRQESMKIKEEKELALQEGRQPSYIKEQSDDRWSLFFEQRLNLTNKLSGHILFQQTSDEDYVKDLDDAIGLLSKTNLERFAKFTYQEDNWTAALNLQHFQILDRNVIPQDPYARMPQLTFSGNWDSSFGLNYGVDAEAVRFTTNVDPKRALRPKSADRFDIAPYLSFRFENSWGFFEPRAALRFTSWGLKYKRLNHPIDGVDQYGVNALNAAIDKQPHYINRVLPIFSVDTGMFFERETNFKNIFGGGDFIQTLEPRLYYLYVPYRKQSHIPILDSGGITPSYNELFTTNDFTGADRQSNANQLTTAITTRFINAESGIEKLKLSVGQIQYFTDPLITLGNDREKYSDCTKRRTNSSNSNSQQIICNKNIQSEWFVENEVAITSDISSKLTWQWSPELKKTTRMALDLKYQPTARQVFNIGHRYSRNIDNPDQTTNQLDITSFWEITNNWSVVGRYNYSLKSHRFIDSYAGFEYNDCCISTRFAARYYREDLYSKDKKWKAYFQIELKGLGNFGQDTMSLWADTISGYSPNR